MLSNEYRFRCRYSFPQFFSGSHVLRYVLVVVFITKQIPEVIEDSGDALNLLWVATQPYLRDGLAGPAGPTITRSVISLMHAFLTKGGLSAGQTIVESGAVAPAVHVSTHVLAGLVSVRFRVF